MAIDANILLAGRVADLGQAAQAGLGAASQFQAIQQQREAFPLAQQQREQALATGDLRNEAAGIDITNARQLQTINKAKALSGVLDTLEGIPSIAGRIQAFAGISENLPELGFTPDQIGRLQQEFDPSDQGLLKARQDLAPALALQDQGKAIQPKFIGTPTRLTRGEGDNKQNFLVGVAQRADGTFGIEEIPVQGEFVSTQGETGRDLGVRQVETSRLKTEDAAAIRKRTEPGIRAAIKAAEVAATARGETLSEFKKATAALPGLIEVTTRLKDLAPIVTNTFSGKIFDAAAKEAGFATKGGTARAEFQSIIDNQVLPLLKPTFGAAFTVAEGDSLRATLGDPDATPEAKVAQIDAFIAQKMRNLQASEAELTKPVVLPQPGGQSPAVQSAAPQEAAVQPTVIRFDAQGNQIQ